MQTTSEGSAPCPDCQARTQRHAQSKPWGGYRMTCLQCCAALVASARPLRRCQEAMLAVIARQPEAPSRAQVLAAVRGKTTT